jgi:hypothetical protein
MPTPTKEQLLRMIDDLQKNPDDRVRIFGDAGICVIGAGLGAAAAGTLTAAVGITTIPGLTAAASFLGISLFAATPVGWAVGLAAAGGALAYGASRLILEGGISEGRKKELLQKYQEDLRNIVAKERAGAIKNYDKTQFFVSVRELIEKDIITPEKAFKLIEQVEQGRILLSQAYSLIQALLREKQS